LLGFCGKVGDRLFALPPGVVGWVAGVDREVILGLGDLDGRPASVRDAVAVVEENDELTE
jgi:hypothetical protein